MRRSIVLGLLLVLPTTAVAQTRGNDQPVAKRCERPGAAQVNEEHRTARLQMLGDLPPANQYLTILRSIDNCPEPVVLRRGIIGDR